MTVVTRFAPSPTGLLHVGGVRTALFSWLYARRRQGKFILRVEDTDRERSTADAVRVILEGMQWLGLAADEGPYYQTQRFDRYREVIAGMLKAGTAYHCYCTKQELDALREAQIARKEKPRYTGICRERTEPRAGRLDQGEGVGAEHRRGQPVGDAGQELVRRQPGPAEPVPADVRRDHRRPDLRFARRPGEDRLVGRLLRAVGDAGLLPDRPHGLGN